jgi:hypothetical protein
MVKYEVKMELDNSDLLKSLIEKSYFDNDNLGKINGNKNFITIDNTFEIYNELKELTNSSIKISNQEIIDGTIRFMVTEDDNNIKLEPISIYCVKEEDKYSFY